MNLNEPVVYKCLEAIRDGLRTKSSVSFNDVMGASGCKKFSVKEIGQALELLRRNKLVKASSRFGCSELLEFSATAVTPEGEKLLKA